MEMDCKCRIKKHPIYGLLYFLPSSVQAGTLFAIGLTVTIWTLDFVTEIMYKITWLK